MPRVAPTPRTPNTGNWRAGNTSAACAHARGVSSVPVRARSFAAWRARATSSQPLFRKGFDLALHMREELVGHRPVDNAVVERDGEERAGSDRDPILPVRARDDFRPLLDGPDPQDRNLPLADDRRSHQGAEDARIRDGAGAVLHFPRIELLCPRASRELVEGLRQPDDRQLIVLLDYRDDETPIECDRHADVELLSIDHAVPRDGRVHDRIRLQP